MYKQGNQCIEKGHCLNVWFGISICSKPVLDFYFFGGFIGLFKIFLIPVNSSKNSYLLSKMLFILLTKQLRSLFLKNSIPNIATTNRLSTKV